MPLSPRTLVTPEDRRRVAGIPGLGGGNAWRLAMETCPAPDLPFLVADRPLVNNDGLEQAEFSLVQLNALTAAWSAWYLDRGVRPRDRVAVYIADSFEDQVHLTALAQIGAIPLLINGRMKPELAAGLMRRTDPVGLYTDAARLELLAGRHEELPGLRWTATREEIGALGTHPLPESAWYRHADDDPVVLCHSSGTTGNPKPVIWAHRQSVAGALFRLNEAPEAQHALMLSAAPQSHSSAIAFTFYAVLAGLPTIGFSEPTGERLAKAIATYRPATVVAFNESLVDLALRDLDPDDCASVEVWSNLGDSGHDVHKRRLIQLGSHVEDGQRLPGSKVTDGLGSSELGWATLRHVMTAGSPPRSRYLGRVVPIADVAVLREDGTRAEAGEVGLLGVRSDAIAHGYWGDSDTTYRSSLAGYWLSGDLVYRDENDDYFHVDRAVDAIRTDRGDGYSVLMEEVLLLALDEVADCAVVAGRDGGRTVPVAVVRPHRPGPAPADLLRQANKALADAGQPELAALEIARSDDDLPTGATGKVLKRLLREKYADLPTYLATRPAGAVAAVRGITG
jgi:acyl-coenzyme A synthetase/AMP-(fatty) acid ligase